MTPFEPPEHIGERPNLLASYLDGVELFGGRV